MTKDAEERLLGGNRIPVEMETEAGAAPSTDRAQSKP
jgi:hypothetical protein